MTSRADTAVRCGGSVEHLCQSHALQAAGFFSEVGIAYSIEWLGETSGFDCGECAQVEFDTLPSPDTKEHS